VKNARFSDKKHIFTMDKVFIIKQVKELIMALLKEDGSLDIERTRQLPIAELVREYGNLNEEQITEYWSKIPLNESQDINRLADIDAFVENNGVIAMKFLNKMRQKYEHKQ